MAGKPKAAPERRQPDDDPLTPAVVDRIRLSIRDRAHDPAQVRRLLAYFSGQTHGTTDSRVNAQIVLYLREAIDNYLRDPRKGRLEAALGLTAPKRRPPSSDTKDRHHLIALQVLKQRLRGRSNDAALAEAGARFAVSTSQAEKVWRAHRDMAFSIECIRRVQAGRRRPLFGASEVKVLRRIYGEDIIDKPLYSAGACK
jgi:hypothetical protein